jgi:hypothetical protein
MSEFFIFSTLAFLSPILCLSDSSSAQSNTCLIRKSTGMEDDV